MTTILKGIAIICHAIAYRLHLIKFQKTTKFELTKENLERANKLQNFLEKTYKTNEEFAKKTKEILTNVPSSNTNSKS